MIQLRSELFASLLYLNQEIYENNYIQCSIRMQKLTFLAQNFLPHLLENIQYKFIPHDFGPYSDELRADLEFEERKGLIEINRNNILNLNEDIEEKNDSNQRTNRNDYRLTNEGLNLLRKRFNSFSIENKYILYAIRNLIFIKTVNLIGIVYNLFPKMANKSKIKPVIEKIPRGEIEAGLRIFLRTLPPKLFLKIYESNSKFSEFFPSIKNNISFEIIKINNNEESNDIKNIITNNYDLLKILSQY